MEVESLWTRLRFVLINMIVSFKYLSLDGYLLTEVGGRKRRKLSRWGTCKEKLNLRCREEDDEDEVGWYLNAVRVGIVSKD